MTLKERILSVCKILGLITGVGILLVLVLIPVGNHYFISTFVRPVLEDFHENDGLLPLIKSDLAALAANPPFPSTESTKNAAHFLQDKRLLIHSDEGRPTKENWQVFVDHRNWKRDPNHLHSLLNDPRLKKIDVSWVEELLEYDHLDYSELRDVQSLLSGVENRNSLAQMYLLRIIPSINFLELQRVLEVYLLQNNNRRGVNLYRHVAYLMHTTGGLNEANFAARLLKEEHYFATYLETLPWNPISKDVVDAYARAIWFWGGIRDRFAADHIWEHIGPYFRPETGACVALAEGLSVARFNDEFIKAKYPFEVDFSSILPSSHDAFQKWLSPCGLKGYSALLASFSDETSWSSHRDNKHQKLPGLMEINYSNVPYLRQMVGGIAVANAVPRYVEIYRSKYQSDATSH